MAFDRAQKRDCLIFGSLDLLASFSFTSDLPTVSLMNYLRAVNVVLEYGRCSQRGLAQRRKMFPGAKRNICIPCTYSIGASRKVIQIQRVGPLLSEHRKNWLFDSGGRKIEMAAQKTMLKKHLSVSLGYSCPNGGLRKRKERERERETDDKRALLTRLKTLLCAPLLSFPTAL